MRHLNAVHYSRPKKAVIQANTSGVDNHSLRLAALEAIDPTEADTGKG